MRSELSSRSESSITQGELGQEDLVHNNNQKQQQQLQPKNIADQNNNVAVVDIKNINLNERARDNSKDSVSTSPESDYLNFDTGDSEEKQFSKFFTPIGILGSGAFGKVVQAREINSKQEYAVKIIAKNNVSFGEIDRLRKEARILSSLDHKNIVKFDRVIESETRIFIVMELLLGGTLRQLMSERKKQNSWFTEKEAALIMNNIINGVAYFHAKSIVHRDLKPENILIGNKNDLSTVKIADFGLSAAFEAKKSISFTQQCGTLIYMAPEFFIQKTYSKPIDIWSCAIIMYQLLSHGTHPLYDPKVDDNKSFKKKIQTSPQIKFPPTFSDITKNLIQKMTLLDVSGRYTANQVTAHPWITQKLEDDIPLTMNEMLSTVNKQTNFSNMQKALCFILFMKMKQDEQQSPLVTSKYKEKCKKFSQKKKKESKTNQKVDIYSQNYLNSIIDLDQSKRISSFISDEHSEDAKSQSNNDDSEDGTTTFQDQQTFIKLPSDNMSSQNDGSSPQQRSSLTSTNQIPTYTKLDHTTQKSASPLLKKYSHRKQLSASIQKGNSSNKNGTGPNLTPFQNPQGVNQFNAISSQNTLQPAATVDKNQKPNSLTLGTNNASNQQRRSTSLHKTNTHHYIDAKQSDQQYYQNNGIHDKDLMIEKLQTKGSVYSKINGDSKESEGNSPSFHIKVLNREELNNQITRKERINTQNSQTIDQQRSVSPRKKNSQMLTIRRDNSRRGQDQLQSNSISPVKVTNSVSPYKNYNFLKSANRNPSMNEEIQELLPPQLTNQVSVNSTICNTITAQRNSINKDSPEHIRRTSQLKNYSDIPEGQKIIHLQKAQMTMKYQQSIPQNSGQHVYTNQSVQSTQVQNLNTTMKLAPQASRPKNNSPPNQHNSGSLILTNSVNHQIQNFAKLSSTQQPQKESFPLIQKALHQVIPSAKGSHNSSTIRERQNRAISYDQKPTHLRVTNQHQSNQNSQILIVENSKQSSQNQQVNQNISSHQPVQEHSTKLQSLEQEDDSKYQCKQNINELETFYQKMNDV